MSNNNRSVTSGITGGIVLIGIALAFAFGGFNLPIFFIILAFASLIGSMNGRNPQRLYGGIQGFLWLFTLAFFFATYQWIWFLVAAGISAILGALIRPIMNGLGGMTSFGMSQQTPPQQYYQPPQPAYPPPPQQYYQPPQPTYQEYQEGYRPPTSATETYEETGQQYQYPSPSQQYEQPQAHYPQEMPPPSQ